MLIYSLFSKYRYSHSVSVTNQTLFFWFHFNCQVLSCFSFLTGYHLPCFQFVSLVWLIWLWGNLPRFKHHEVIFLILKNMRSPEGAILRVPSLDKMLHPWGRLGDRWNHLILDSVVHHILIKVQLYRKWTCVLPINTKSAVYFINETALQRLLCWLSSSECNQQTAGCGLFHSPQT